MSQDEKIEQAKREVISLMNAIDPNPGEPHEVSVKPYAYEDYEAMAWSGTRGVIARHISGFGAVSAIQGLPLAIARALAAK